MKNLNKTVISLCIGLSSLTNFSFAAAPQAIHCVTATTTPGWSYEINLTNNCNSSIDLKNAVISFQTSQALNSLDIWGFNNTAYPSPSPDLKKTSDNPIHYSYTYQFGPWATAEQTQLAPGKSTNLVFSSPTNPQDFSVSDIALYAGTAPVSEKGDISFSSATNLPQDSSIEVKGDNNVDFTIPGRSFANNSYVLKDIPFGHYTLSGNVVVNGQTQNLDVTPNSLTLSNTVPTAKVSVKMPTPVATVAFSFQLPNKPNDSGLTDALVVTASSGDKTITSKPVAWGQTVNLSVPEGEVNYAFSIPDAVGRYGIYHFDFSPSSHAANGDANIHVNYHSTPITTYPVSVNISGLPQLGAGQFVTVDYTDDQNNTYTDHLASGSNASSLASGTYAVAAASMTIDGHTYTAKPTQLSVGSGLNQVNISFVEQQAAPFIPYFDATVNANWNANQPADMDAYMQETGVKTFHAAFITDAGKCQPAWAGVSALPATGGSSAWGYDWFKHLRAEGGNAIIAFGGATGTDLSVNCSVSQLIDQYENIINTYQPAGLDFDIEGGFVANPDAYGKIMEALKTIEAQYPALPISFTLPTMPNGLDANGLNVVKTAVAAKLNFTTNIMAMDYGPAYSTDMGQYAIDAAEGLFKQLQNLYGNSKTSAELYNMIGITPMIGVNDVAGEYFTLEDAKQVADYANSHHIAFLSEWSSARDNPCQDTSASPICSGSKDGVMLQDQPNEFTKTFVGK